MKDHHESVHRVDKIKKHYGHFTGRQVAPVRSDTQTDVSLIDVKEEWSEVASGIASEPVRAPCSESKPSRSWI